jgi:hypothetical protein
MSTEKPQAYPPPSQPPSAIGFREYEWHVTGAFAREITSPATLQDVREKTRISGVVVAMSILALLEVRVLYRAGRNVDGEELYALHPAILTDLLWREALRLPALPTQETTR